MDTMMAVCGLDCRTCNIRLVPTDPEAARRVVAWFHEMGWLEEDEGVEEVLDHCAQCEEFVCEKLEAFAADGQPSHREAVERLKRMAKS